MKINEFELIALNILKNGIKNSDDLDSAKREISKKEKIKIPTNTELLEAYHKLVKNKRLKTNANLEFILRKKKIRSLSGIVNVSVLTKPYPCPGKCIYCPSQSGIPKSYMAKEPAVQRAILNNFDPFRQVKTRLEALQKIGHPTDKIELRIIGGTWSYYPKKYQIWFIKRCFEASNEQSGKRKAKNAKQQRRIKNLKIEQKQNEKAKNRIIGITIETRQDYINEKEIKTLRDLGVTRVELGAQSVYDDVLKLNKRGHDVATTIKATKMLKDAGFKVAYQMMPNLPGSNFKKDIAMFKELFSNPNFKPDLLKIYPLALIKNSVLYKKYGKKFKTYPQKKLARLLIEIKKQIPYWCRIQRIIRDIPSKDIVSGGAKISNLREIIQQEMKKQGIKCKCIRCREVKENYNPKEKIYLFREDYEASEGKEIFLSYENKTRTQLYSLLRLRIPSPSEHCVLPVLKNVAIIREVHTYGQLLPIADRDRISVGSPQHRGMGKQLIREAEKIAKQEFKLKKIAVISGIGAREYYRKLGYKLKDTYMVK